MRGILKAAQEKSRTSQEKQRNGELRDHQCVAKTMMPSRAASGAATGFKRVGQIRARGLQRWNQAGNRARDERGQECEAEDVPVHA